MPRPAGAPADWASVMLNNYGTPALRLTHGHGTTVWDSEGRGYLDLLAGIATSSLGHAHPAIVEAVSRQVSQLGHTSNLYQHDPGLALAAAIQSISTPDARVFFCQDGASANETAIKLSRLHGRARPGPDGTPRTEIIAFTRGFHGRTMGALSVTGNDAKRIPFEPLLPAVRFLPYGDAVAVAEAVTESTAAVICEPILGEGGVVEAPAGFLAAIRRCTTTVGALMIVDEVQTGFGRTGAWLASLADGITPDIVTLAKGLAGGLPLGACVALTPAAQLFAPGDHGSTFGGNPVSCAAAVAVAETIEADGLLDHVATVGAHWIASLRALDHPLVANVRGRGFLIGIGLTEPVAPAVEAAARDMGFLVNAVAPDTIRLAPPLILTAEEAARFTRALPSILDRVTAGEASQQ